LVRDIIFAYDRVTAEKEKAAQRRQDEERKPGPGDIASGSSAV